MSLVSKNVKPEHLLIGLVRQNDGIAAKLLKNLMVNPEKICVELVKLNKRP
jgi:ATP-dependent Clp protease ATP-binding subunit ClpA